jgi:hypothetical protein
VSPAAQDNQDARLWFNYVEEMVFTDEDFCADVESPTDFASPATVLSVTPKLQALQAAYIVCLYQNWEGADTSKRRIRRHRFSTVVSVGSLPSATRRTAGNANRCNRPSEISE